MFFATNRRASVNVRSHHAIIVIAHARVRVSSSSILVFSCCGASFTINFGSYGAMGCVATHLFGLYYPLGIIFLIGSHLRFGGGDCLLTIFDYLSGDHGGQ